MDEKNLIFHGELQLTAWGDSSTTGPWVKFWCHPDDLEQFKLLRMRKGNKEAGTRLGAAMVEIGDDEEVVKQPAALAPAPRPNAYKVKVGDIGMKAVAWCRSPDFHRWLFDEEADGRWLASVLERGITKEAASKEWMLEVCGVVAKYGTAASRKHLDHDADAGRLFHERIHTPYLEYLNDRTPT